MVATLKGTEAFEGVDDETDRRTVFEEYVDKLARRKREKIN